MVGQGEGGSDGKSISLRSLLVIHTAAHKALCMPPLSWLVDRKMDVALWIEGEGTSVWST